MITESKLKARLKKDPNFKKKLVENLTKIFVKRIESMSSKMLKENKTKKK